MTLDMLGAVMSKTDLHFIDPRDIYNFCESHRYSYRTEFCDYTWGNGNLMVEDLKQRIPLALKDGNLQIPSIEKFSSFLYWLDNQRPSWKMLGATAVYRITID
jgi:hypothetical protein